MDAESAREQADGEWAAKQTERRREDEARAGKNKARREKKKMRRAKKDGRDEGEERKRFMPNVVAGEGKGDEKEVEVGVVEEKGITFLED